MECIGNWKTQFVEGEKRGKRGGEGERKEVWNVKTEKRWMTVEAEVSEREKLARVEEEATEVQR